MSTPARVFAAMKAIGRAVSSRELSTLTKMSIEECHRGIGDLVRRKAVVGVGMTKVTIAGLRERATKTYALTGNPPQPRDRTVNNPKPKIERRSEPRNPTPVCEIGRGMAGWGKGWGIL